MTSRLSLRDTSAYCLPAWEDRRKIIDSWKDGVMQKDIAVMLNINVTLVHRCVTMRHIYSDAIQAVDSMTDAQVEENLKHYYLAVCSPAACVSFMNISQKAFEYFMAKHTTQEERKKRAEMFCARNKNELTKVKDNIRWDFSGDNLNIPARTSISGVITTSNTYIGCAAGMCADR